MSSLSATIRVRVEVEVIVGNWDASTSFESLREQASREAKQQVQSVIHKSGSSMRVVGDPKSMHVVLSGDLDQ